MCEPRLLLAAPHQHGLHLVPVAEATHVATKSGGWQVAAVWGGQVPTAGSRVHVPKGLIVTVNQRHGAAMD